MANHKARLQVVASRRPTDTILRGKQPLLAGDDDEDLVCGHCGAILGNSVSRKTVFLRFGAVTGQLLIECPQCAADNAVKVTKPSPVVSVEQGGEA